MSEFVVKDNVLIQASYTLDTVEQRLILLAITEARQTGRGITENSLLEIHASSYINTFNVESILPIRCSETHRKAYLIDMSHTMISIQKLAGTVVSIVVGLIELTMSLNQVLFS